MTTRDVARSIRRRPGNRTLRSAIINHASLTRQESKMTHRPIIKDYGGDKCLFVSIKGEGIWLLNVYVERDKNNKYAYKRKIVAR